MWRVSRLATLF